MRGKGERGESKRRRERERERELTKKDTHTHTTQPAIADPAVEETESLALMSSLPKRVSSCLALAITGFKRAFESMQLSKE